LQSIDELIKDRLLIFQIFFDILWIVTISHNAASDTHELTNLGNTTYDNRNIFTYEVTLICTWKTEVLYVMHILISFFIYVYIFIRHIHMYAHKYVYFLMYYGMRGRIYLILRYANSLIYYILFIARRRQRSAILNV